QLPDMAAEAFVEKIDRRPDARLVAHPLVRQQPQDPSMLRARRDAADKVGIGIRHDARQDGDSKAGSHGGKEARGRRMVHRDLIFEAELPQPCLIVSPEIAAPTADDRVIPEILDRSRHTMPRCVITAAVKRPIVDPEASPDQSQRLLSRAAAEGDVGLSLAQISHLLAGIELDDDFWMVLVKLPQEGGKQPHRVNIFRRDPDGPTKFAAMGCCSVAEAACRGFNLFRPPDQFLPGRSGRVAGLTPLEEWKAERTLERGNSARDGRLADAKRTTGG